MVESEDALCLWADKSFSPYWNIAAVFGVLWLSCLLLKVVKVVAGDFCAFFLAPWGISRTNLKKYGSWGVVTGASEGIGKGYALELARQGLNVVIMSRTKEKLQKLADEIKKQYGREVKVIVVDFSDGMKIYPSIAKQLKHLDIGILINNVGIAFNIPDFVHERSADEFHKMIEVNCQSMVQMTKLLLPKMLEKKRGIIINLSSCVTDLVPPMLAGYTATKDFAAAFSDGLYKEYTHKGIIVQCVAPYFVSTAMSGIDSVSYWVPDPVAYARAAVATIGVNKFTRGYFSHAIQGYVSHVIPSFVMDHFLWRARLAAKERHHINKLANSYTEPKNHNNY